MQRLGRMLAPAGTLIARVASGLFRRYELDEHIVAGWKSSSGARPVINHNAPADVRAASAAHRQTNLLRRQMRAYLRTL